MNDSAHLLTIGDLARASGKSASSIRYYERIGVIPAPPRAGGRRRYPAATVRTLAVIDIAQRAGLTLDEIRDLLAASADDPAAVSARLRQVAERKLPATRAVIERAESARRWQEAAAGCTCPSLDECPLFDE
jgi:MerR family redox-sensitive transcriptional activator SoxR